MLDPAKDFVARVNLSGDIINQTTAEKDVVGVDMIRYNELLANRDTALNKATNYYEELCGIWAVLPSDIRKALVDKGFKERMKPETQDQKNDKIMNTLSQMANAINVLTETVNKLSSYKNNEQSSEGGII